MPRVIKGLLHARLLSSPPSFAKNSRIRGRAKKAGVQYEKAIQESLPGGWTRGQWIEFMDAAGHGYCQLDFHHCCLDGVVVLESKLSWVPEGHSQLELLYRPVVEMIWGKPMIGLVVAKRLTPECKAAIAQTLPSAINAAKSSRKVVLHWTGKSPLIPRPCSVSSPKIPLSPPPA